MRLIILSWFLPALVWLDFSVREFKKCREGKYRKYSSQNLWPVARVLDFVWRKEYLWLFFTIGLLGSLLLLLTNASVNDHLIFYTLVIILWNSRETMDLKRNSTKEIEHLRKQYTTSIRPYLRLQKSSGENRPQLINEGKGVAVDLRPIYKGENREVPLFRIPAMAAAPGSVTESFVPRNLGLELDPSVANFIIEITYTDLEDRRYIAIFQTNTDYNDGFEIIKQEEIKDEN